MLSGDSSPFFEVIFILLCVEGAITTLLVAPLPPSVRAKMLSVEVGVRDVKVHRPPSPYGNSPPPILAPCGRSASRASRRT